LIKFYKPLIVFHSLGLWKKDSIVLRGREEGGERERCEL